MSACKCARYDAAGHKILSHSDMILYYQHDSESLSLVKRFMPHRLVVLPSVEIVVDIHTPETVDVYLIYPGETKQMTKDISVHGVEGLRRTYRGRKGWKIVGNRIGSVSLRFEGRVVLDPKKRFGIRA